MPTVTTAARPLVEVRALAGREARQVMPRIVSALESRYGPDGEPTTQPEPLDEMIAAALLEGSRRRVVARALRELTRAFVDWNEVRISRPGEVQSVIEPISDARGRSERIVRSLNSLFAERGTLSLAFLHEATQKDARAFLSQLDGVDGEMLSRVMFFALGHPAVPMSTHIARVSARIGLVAAEATLDRMRGRLERIVPRSLMRLFHDLVNEHGRKTCLVNAPRCRRCAVLRYCCTGRALTVASKKKRPSRRRSARTKDSKR